MIQFKRGSTDTWKNLKTPLADGQPGYDRENNRFKIGDGKKLWDELPNAGGLAKEEILSSEAAAKIRRGLFSRSEAIITYGEASPDKNTLGELYLQQYDSEPEADYIIETGINGIWQYQKWHHGSARCWGMAEISTKVDGEVGNLYSNSSTMSAISYPFKFSKVPVETATLQNSGHVAWLASGKANTKEKSSTYNIISIDKSESDITFKIALSVEGFWK